MADITNSVIVNVSVDDTPLSQAAFNIAAIVGPNATFSTKTKKYKPTSLTDIAADLTNGVDDPEYVAALKIASQQILVSEIMIIKEEVGDTDMQDTLNQAKDEDKSFFGVAIVDRTDEDKVKDASAWCKANDRFFFSVSNDLYIVNDPAAVDTQLMQRLIFSEDTVTLNNIDMTVNGTAITTVPFNADHVTTMGDLITELVGLAEVDTAVLDSADPNNRTIIVTGPGPAALNITGAVVTGGASQPTITVKGQTIASYLNGLANDQTMLFYHSQVGGDIDQHIDAAAMGRILPKIPGSYTAKHQRIFEVTADILSDSQSTNAHAKGANTYEEIANRNVILNGTVPSGGFVDVAIFRLWLKARVSENVFLLLSSNEKIPFTQAGINSIESAIEQILKVGQNNGGISPEEFNDDEQQIGGYTIVMPRLQDVTPVDKAARTLRNVQVKAWLAGAIHATIINITLQL